MESVLRTPLTRRLGMKHPVLLAGMARISNAELAAAVSNAGGLGVIGGALIGPKQLRAQLRELKSLLREDNLPFGVDLMLPKVGKGARRTNYDYTKGQLEELVDVCIEERAKLFVCAVGVPPIWVVERLHKGGVLVMNMIGSPKHVQKALSVGVDALCAQGSEAGGHTGDISTMALVPQIVDLSKDAVSPLTGEKVHVVGAGGIYDGRGLVACLSLGAEAVWVGTRFVATHEASCGSRHKQSIVAASAADTVRTLIYSGRPMRVLRTPYVDDWESRRQSERDTYLRAGKLPYKSDLKKQRDAGTPLSFVNTYLIIFGQAAGGINSIMSAEDVVRSMIRDAEDSLRMLRKFTRARY
eukprot:g1449.t1